MLKNLNPKTRFEFWNIRILNLFRISNFEFRISPNGGFGLVEMVIVTAIVSGSLFAFLQAEILSVRLLRSEKENLEATLLAEEALEAVRSVRDESWTTISASTTNGTIYYPSVENGKWKLSTSSPGIINGKYKRFVIFSEVLRDTQDRIAASGTADPDTRKVTAYATTTTKQITLVTYITNFQSYLPRPTEAKVISFEGATTDANLASFPSNNLGDGDPAQGFTTLVDSLQVTKVELYLRRTTVSPSDVYAELRTTATGTVLGISNIITASTISSTSPAWIEFRFPDPVNLSALTKYYIRLRSIPDSTAVGSGSAGNINWFYLQTGSSPYAGGEARRYVGRLSNPTDAGQQLDQYDFGFRVYALQ